MANFRTLTSDLISKAAIYETAYDEYRAALATATNEIRDIVGSLIPTVAYSIEMYDDGFSIVFGEKQTLTRENMEAFTELFDDSVNNLSFDGYACRVIF